MLHEVLLALSGHPSPVLGNASQDTFPLLTSAESELLSSLGRLATLHRALKSHLPRISAYHPSLICRALATAISCTHLSALQDLILETERQILAKNAAIVGAYDIVPLATILNKFEPWKRRLDWFWELSCFLYSADAEPLSSSMDPSPLSACTGPAILNWLRNECRTGYPDIEAVATALLAVGERSWLRQLCNWLLHKSLVKIGSWDLFLSNLEIRAFRPGQPLQNIISTDLLPTFVTSETAMSILFISRTLQMLQPTATEAAASASTTSALVQLNLSAEESIIPPSFLEKLSTLSSPIVPAAFSGLISALRAHVAATLVDAVLPINQLINTLDLFRKFFLAARPEFVDALIAEADQHIAIRHAQSTRGLQTHVGERFVGVVLKDSEARGVLSKTWPVLAPTIGNDAVAEDDIEWAREHLSLQILPPDSRSVSRPPFESFLLHTPTALSAHLESVFDLLLSPDDLAMYSSIHSYLTAIRRAHNHVAELWRQTSFRRDHPAPIRRGRSSKAFPIIRKRRRVVNRRMQRLRGVWSICTTTNCLLAALGDYLVEEVIERSWAKFHNWTGKTGAELPSTMRDAELPQDPEVLAYAHRQYLEGLAESLLLTDQRYVALLKSLLEQVEQVVAYVRKLGDIQRSIDLHDEGVVDGARGRLEADEQDTLIQLDQGSNTMGNSLSKLKEHLRTMALGEARHRPVRAKARNFEPYFDGNGLERLLTRLDGGLAQQAADEEGEEVAE